MMPDLTGIFYLAMFGLICGCIIAFVGGSWITYHLIMALTAYVGG